MFEYIITHNNKFAAMKGSNVEWVSFAFATVFKKKERAEKVSAKCGGTVEPHYGKAVVSNKSFVAPKQSSINHTAPYRSI